MDILAQLGCSASRTLWSTRTRSTSPLRSPPFNPRCSGQDSQRPRQNGDADDTNNNDKKGQNFSTDWDKAWSSFRKQGKPGKKTLFSGFSPNKYVSWNPRRSNYPLSEEVDPIRRTERSNLMLWTSPRFTLVVAILIVSFLLLYTILAPVK